MKCLLFLLAVSSRVAAAALPTCVLLDSMGRKLTHSLFFSDLEGQGHRLMFHRAGTDSLNLSYCDNLVIIAPDSEVLGAHVEVEDVVAFVDAGHNLIVAVDETVSNAMRELANYCGVDFDLQGTVVLDGENFNRTRPSSSSFSPHTIIASQEWGVMAVVGDAPSSPVLYKGIGHAVVDGSDQIFTALHGNPSSYSNEAGRESGDASQAVGRDTLLVSGMQTRNGARTLFSGSLLLCSDQYITSPVSLSNERFSLSGNRKYCAGIVEWTLQQRARLRAHLSPSTSPSPSSHTCRVGESLPITLTLQQFDQSRKEWAQYDAEDGMKLTMERIDFLWSFGLTRTGPGQYSTTLRAPTVQGVFNCRVHYLRPGFTEIDLSFPLTVLPPPPLLSTTGMLLLNTACITLLLTIHRLSLQAGRPPFVLRPKQPQSSHK